MRHKERTFASGRDRFVVPLVVLRWRARGGHTVAGFGSVARLIKALRGGTRPLRVGIIPAAVRVGYGSGRRSFDQRGPQRHRDQPSADQCCDRKQEMPALMAMGSRRKL